jgi:hypothetical protein
MRGIPYLRVLALLPVLACSKATELDKDPDPGSDTATEDTATDAPQWDCDGEAPEFILPMTAGTSLPAFSPFGENPLTVTLEETGPSPLVVGENQLLMSIPWKSMDDCDHPPDESLEYCHDHTVKSLSVALQHIPTEESEPTPSTHVGAFASAYTWNSEPIHLDKPGEWRLIVSVWVNLMVFSELWGWDDYGDEEYTAAFKLCVPDAS